MSGLRDVLQSFHIEFSLFDALFDSYYHTGITLNCLISCGPAVIICNNRALPFSSCHDNFCCNINSKFMYSFSLL